MSLLFFREKKKEPTPITDVLTETAHILGMETPPPESNGFLFQAEIMREIARRVVELEKKQ